MIEGELRCEELSQYLDNIHAPKCVWISEDATAIIPKINYDPVTCQLVGIPLPIDKVTGCPKMLAYETKTQEEITEHMKKKKSTSVYVVMAQPLDERFPPFILQLWGIDNTFEAEDVSNRWDYTENELAKYGIVVAGFSSDADSRPLSVMSDRMIFGESDSKAAQDSIHIATKCRNRLLNLNVSLQMGTCKVSVEHLKSLIEKVPRSVHGLFLTDVCPHDRQNFRSFEKIVEPRVLNALEQNIAESQATIKYLKLCRDITSSYMDYNLNPIERVTRIWRSLYFCRIWREFIVKSKHYTLLRNFITLPVFKCIEINARNLLALIRKFRENGTPQFFIPPLYQSQTCEKVFRQFRSMGTMNFTKINFSILDFLYMVGRVEVQNEILHFKLFDKGIRFPKLEVDSRKTTFFDMPSDDEIENALKTALTSAIEDANVFDMYLDETVIQNYHLPRRTRSSECVEEEAEESEDEFLSENGAMQIDEMERSDDLSDIYQIDKNENKHFVEVTCDGVTKVLRKSSLVWLLSENNIKLSNDRLRRVQTRSQQKKPGISNKRNHPTDTQNEIHLAKQKKRTTPNNKS